MLDLNHSNITSDIKNIAEKLYTNATQFPNKTALILENGQTLTYSEVVLEVQVWRTFFQNNGYHEGDHVLVLLPVCKEFIFVFFALFAENIIPVLIDPRLKKNLWKKYIAESNTKAIISNSKILRLRWVWRWMNKYTLIDATSALKSLLPSIPHSQQSIQLPKKTADNASVLLTLTSGTTGPAKIISRNFRVLKNQQKFVSKYLPPLKNDIHLALHGVALLHCFVYGSTAVLAINHSPKNLLKLISKNKVTRFSTPPGTLAKITAYLKKNQRSIETNSLSNIITGGAPIPRWLIKETAQCFSHSSINIVYGSTECEPISSIKINSDFYDSKDFGYNVGKFIPELSTQLIPFAYVNNKELFEVLLKGSNCFSNADNGYLHTGDIAYLNQFGELMLIGRKSDLSDWPLLGYWEEMFENIEGVSRVAIKPIGNKSSMHLFIEPHSKINWKELKIKVEKVIEINRLNLDDLNWKIKRIRRMPVDARHGWKIQRHLL